MDKISEALAYADIAPVLQVDRKREATYNRTVEVQMPARSFGFNERTVPVDADQSTKSRRSNAHVVVPVLDGHSDQIGNVPARNLDEIDAIVQRDYAV